MTDGRELRFENRGTDIEEARARLHAFLDEHAVGARAGNAAELVLEEWLLNVRQHGLSNEALTPIEVRIRLAGAGLKLCFSHEGPAFDPTVVADPLPAATLADAPIGGRGLMLMRRVAREIRYRRDGARDILCVDIDD